MVVTVSGMVILVNELQDENAFEPIAVNESGSIKSDKPLQLEKA